MQNLHLIRIITLNVGRDFERKIKHTVRYALAEDADVLVLTETCEGAAIQSICSKQGYTVFATEKDQAQESPSSSRNNGRTQGLNR
jgi:hypothetical protein